MELRQRRVLDVSNARGWPSGLALGSTPKGAEAIVTGIMKKMLWLGFMYAVLLHADTWIPAIIRSFMVAGQQAANVEKLNPGEVFTEGLGLGVKMLKEMAMSWRRSASACCSSTGPKKPASIFQRRIKS